MAAAAALRFRGGDFPTRHDDPAEGKQRRLAYVHGLTPGWQPEWGGLLPFNHQTGGIARTIVPCFDALSLFRVPQPHSVGSVAPFARAVRLCVTGWVRACPPPAWRRIVDAQEPCADGDHDFGRVTSSVRERAVLAHSLVRSRTSTSIAATSPRL